MKLDEAPALDLSREDHRRMEALGVVENVLTSMLGGVP